MSVYGFSLKLGTRSGNAGCGRMYEIRLIEETLKYGCMRNVLGGI